MNFFLEVVDIFGRWDDDLKSTVVAFEVAPKREFGSHTVGRGDLFVTVMCANESNRT